MSVMRESLAVLKRVSAFFRAHRIQLELGIRVTAAALAALVIAMTFGLKLPLWAVLTSIIVTQMSVGRSLKATRDYLIGTIGGAIYGGAVAILIPHQQETALLLVLILAVAPLAFIAAINPSLNVAPITAIIVLLLPLMNHNTPLESAVDRIIEVTVGALTGLLVSFIVLPSRAHSQVRASTAEALDLIATALTELLAALTRGRDNEALHRLQDGIGQAITTLQAIGGEAERERAAHLSKGPDTGPLLRTTLRLRHDLVMIGRSTVVPLPSPLQIRLAGPLLRVSEAMATFLHSTAVALRSGTGAPAIYPVQTALKAYGEEVSRLRQDGLTRGLPGDMAERFFAIGFSLEQMRQNLKDLERCVAEWAEVDPPMRGAKIIEPT